MRAKTLNKIENVEMLGDKFHNEIIDTLFNGLPARSKYKNRILFRLDLVYESVDKRWTELTKTNARKLNAIMKSKTDKTFQKRLKAYINHLAYGTHYGQIFNRDEIKELSKEIVEE